MTTKKKEEISTREIPEFLIDPTTKKRYSRGRFLGKGAFAKCYELIDVETKEVFAGKIVSKALLVQDYQKQKMSQEISIHRTLVHKHIVTFHSFFEDVDNVYIILELCRRRSLMEMRKRRKTLTEPETRYFLRQILLACKYLHEEKIIHRDLKLNNLFLSDEMEIKLGDFGLATRVDYDGERKKTVCGTPNYIAPEVITKKGHSFEVDVWSIGCILYTLLVGKPPFESSRLKETYMRITKNEYHIPSKISPVARVLIQKLLRPEPAQRPSVNEILCDEFLSLGIMPTRLPTSCLTMAPRFEHVKSQVDKSSIPLPASRKPLIDVNKEELHTVKPQREELLSVPKEEIMSENDENEDKVIKAPGNVPPDFYLSDLFSMLTSVVASKPAEKAVIQLDEAEDPAAVPIFWVSKWVDYTDKYGLGYQLCDNSVGVLFNDNTRIILLTDGQNFHYIERNGNEYFYTLQDYPQTVSKKVTLLKYFQNYMNEHLLKAGESIVPREGDEISRLPHLRAWFRTKSAIVLHLANGTLQINFFDDHTKIILCPLMGAVSYIDGKRDFKTYRLNLIKKYGCTRELASRLRYAKTITERLMATKSGSVKGRPS
ncbi:serine/threonine-protein kinase PLK1 [Centruroides vittatus]|uniref:serine/threonine-protein kinase PLK1 n=1 Tax=Centruroides vittatus TaxID=120091 RepID=UPI003510816F